MRASVPTLHGSTIMASVWYEPLATLAPMSVLFCCWIFCEGRPSSLCNDFVAARHLQLFGHHAQSAVGEDNVDSRDALIAVQRVEQVLGEDGAARAGDGDGQRPRCCIGWRGHLSFTSYHSNPGPFWRQYGHIAPLVLNLHLGTGNLKLCS